MDEFDLIRRFFSRDGASPGVIVGVGDDGAILRPTPGFDQVHVIDTLVEGVHFPANIDAEDIGYRVVAVNLSDIAAMGATPRWMTLALTLWDKDEEWVERFANGLYSAAAEHGVALVGGDTTQGDAVVATVHMMGEVEQGSALLRSGARVGDTVYVTGTVGDAAAGLSLLQSDVSDDELIRRFLRPDARVAAGRALRGRASAAIDISDGLIADLGKLAAASGVGAEIDVDRLPLSAAMLSRYDKSSAQNFALTGGDDYELCFTAPAGAVTELDGIIEIGVITDGERIVCRRDGKVVEVDEAGYRHFS
ncbi:MAG: thiamine-phosphate kinase [Woeseiaceae bacterium]|nr:thiamine-phosphate kinase [Woeseiaceae bacterium]